MSRPRVLYSECLGIRPVRYNGGIVFDKLAEILKKYVDVVPVCPEVGIGLGIPRNPLVLYRENDSIELIDTVTSSKYTKDVEEFTRSIVRDLVVDGALLKSASPSCGVGDAKIYGPDRRVIRKGDGIFTSILKKYMPCLPVESEKRLYNYDIRRTFLTKVFSLAELRETLGSLRSYEELADFHRRYKYLLMLHNPTALKNLGRLVANRIKYAISDLAIRYRDEFIKALCRNPSRKSYVNVFMHIYGHLKEELNPSERTYVINLIKNYRLGRESIRAVIVYFYGFVHRFKDRYLAEQKFLSPYPEELDHVELDVV